MESLAEQLNAYAAYHRAGRNKRKHFVGVPLVMFSLFIPMGWFRLVHAADVPPLNGATIFYLSVFAPFADSATVFFATFLGPLEVVQIDEETHLDFIRPRSAR